MGSRSLLATACAAALRPVVRLLLKSGWTHREFADLARRVFVEVASTEFGKRGRPANASRVAILTGINRKDVSRLRAEHAPNDDAAASIEGYSSPGSRVLSGWHRDPEFLEPSGVPRQLRFESGDGPSFTELVRRYAADLPVVAMLKELQAAGAVDVGGDRTVRVLARAYVPRAFDPNLLRLWSSALVDLGTTLEANVTRAAGAPSRFERAAVSNEVDARQLPAFRAFLEREGQAFLERVDEWIGAHPAVGPDAERRRVRLGAGVYQIESAPAPIVSEP